jgi:hypothetical protein
MARLIDVNCLVKDIEKIRDKDMSYEEKLVVNSFMLLALVQPTVDAVEVVRCKDCLNGKQIPRSDLYVECMVLGKVMCGDDYCSWGVKPDGGDEE